MSDHETELTIGHPTVMSTNAQVVILGGGFGGVYTARHLETLKAAGAPIDVTLVSRDNFFLFTPMLHEVAASDLDITHIVSPLRTLLRHSTIFVGDVESVDPGTVATKLTAGSAAMPPVIATPASSPQAPPANCAAT